MRGGYSLIGINGKAYQGQWPDMESAAQRRFRTVFLSFDGRLLELPIRPAPRLVYDVSTRQAHRTIARERELACGSGHIELKLDVHTKHDGVVVGLIR